MRVVVADYHRVALIGLKVILERESDIRVVGEACTGQEAIGLVARVQPDVALIDLALPDGFGVSLVSLLLGAAPRLRVVEVSASADTLRVQSSLAAGVHGYVSKAVEPDELVRAVRSVAAGRMFFSVPMEEPRSDVPKERAEGGAHGSREPRMVRPLSGRERQVLELFAEGRTHRQIADILGVGERTVETYRSRLGDKFGVRSRAELVYSATKLGLLPVR